MKFTPIPDREAAELLGTTRANIRYAVQTGALTRVPMAGQLQHVAKEQVLLFQGKKKINIRNLSSDELRAWQALKDAILAPTLTIKSEQELAQEIANRLAPQVLQYIGSYIAGVAQTESEEPGFFLERLKMLSLMR